MYCFHFMHTLIVHKNCHAEFFVPLWECIEQVRTILSSGNIIIVFSTPSFLGFLHTPNFMLVACLVWQKITLNFAIYRENPSSNKCHYDISDDCTPTIDYLKLKLYRT